VKIVGSFGMGLCVLHFVGFGRPFLIGKRLETPLCAQAIHIALREDRAQPSREAAAALKVPEQRFAVQVCVDGIGELTRAAGWVEGVGGAVEDRPVLEHEALPRLLVSSGALPREL
jgi:hypothetical protein